MFPICIIVPACCIRKKCILRMFWRARFPAGNSFVLSLMGSRRPRGWKFIEALEKTGYDVKTKDLQIFPDGSKKGDWDVGIAIDAVKMSRSLDVLVLISGDGDYIPLVEYVQNTTGCRVEVIAFGESASAKLVEQADEFTNLSENHKKYLMGG